MPARQLSTSIAAPLPAKDGLRGSWINSLCRHAALGKGQTGIPRPRTPCCQSWVCGRRVFVPASSCRDHIQGDVPRLFYIARSDTAPWRQQHCQLNDVMLVMQLRHLPTAGYTHDSANAWRMALVVLDCLRCRKRERLCWISQIGCRGAHAK